MDLAEILNFLRQEQAWWVYVIATLLPICMFIFVREFNCWLFKTNRLVRHMKDIEKRLGKIERSLGAQQPPPPRQPSTPPSDEQYNL